MVNTQYDQQKRYTEYFNIVLAICAHPGTDKSIEKKVYQYLRYFFLCLFLGQRNTFPRCFVLAQSGSQILFNMQDGGTAFLLGAAFIQAVNQQIKSGKIKCLKMFDVRK